jgi:hypothetical protein
MEGERERGVLGRRSSDPAVRIEFEGGESGTGPWIMRIGLWRVVTRGLEVGSRWRLTWMGCDKDRDDNWRDRGSDTLDVKERFCGRGVLCSARTA